MFKLRRAQKFRRMSTNSFDDDEEEEGKMTRLTEQQKIKLTEQEKPMKLTENSLEKTDNNLLFRRAGGEEKKKPSLLRFAQTASRVVEHETWEEGGKDKRSSQQTPITPTTPLKDAATKVKNAKSAVFFMQNASIKSRLKDRIRKIAEERLTVRQIFRRYVDQSTLHGFRYTVSDTYYVRRFIWACLMIMGAIYFILKLKEGIIEYYSYPFSTLSTLEYVGGSLPFPAVSLCSVNQFKMSRLKNSSLYPLYLDNRLPLSRNWSDPGYDIPGDELYKELKKVSLNIDDIFMECDWISRDTDHPKVPFRNCSSANYTTHFSESGQICFTLNSGEKGHTKLSVDHAGMKYGYEALFDFNNDDVIPFEDFTGFHVIVHNPDEIPYGKVGFVISPGFKVYANLQREETINLESPYSTHCGEKKLKYYDVYSQKSCLKERLTDYVGVKCGCREFHMPDNGLPYCSLRETILCAFPACDSFDQFKERLECPIDCEIIEYNTRVTESRFIHDPPTGIEPEIIKQAYKSKNLTNSHILNLYRKMNATELDKYIENNVVQIILFFGEMSKTIHTQEASFDFYQFLGDMGGEIGLMLGASLLTFVEFIDLLGFLGYHQLLRITKRQNKSEEEKEHDENDNVTKV